MNNSCRPLTPEGIEATARYNDNGEFLAEFSTIISTDFPSRIDAGYSMSAKSFTLESGFISFGQLTFVQPHEAVIILNFIVLNP